MCVCMCPIVSTKAIAFTMIHHRSIALFALQQYSHLLPGAAFPPSRHSSKIIYNACIPTASCNPHMHAPFPVQGSPPVHGDGVTDAALHAVVIRIIVSWSAFSALPLVCVCACTWCGLDEA